MKKIKVLFVLIMSVCSFLTACGTQAENEQTENYKIQSSNYIEEISAGGGLTDEENAKKVRYQPEELKEEIVELLKQTKDASISQELINLETALITVDWLNLVDKCVSPENNADLKNLLQEHLATYTEAERKELKEKFIQVVNVAIKFTDGHPSIVGLIRSADINPSKVPFVSDHLEHWARLMFMD